MADADIYSLEFFPLVAEITQEIDNHIGINDKTAAEFLINLHDGSNQSLVAFKAKVKEMGLDSTESFVENVDRLILSMHPKYKKRHAKSADESAKPVDSIDGKRTNTAVTVYPHLVQTTTTSISMSKYDDILSSMLSEEPEWSKEDEQALLEPFKYITSNPGKEIRGKLIEAFNIWLNVPPERLQVIAKIVNMLHAASLMIDDIEDDSQLRRGKPVAHKIYGIPQTINTANYVYFLAYKELFALRTDSPPRDLDALVTAELLSLHRGQGQEIIWRDSLRCPSEEEYIRMVNNKTGGLLRIGIKLMMACCTTNTGVNYVPLVNLIGVFFQIRDDLMNLQSAEYTSNKGFAEDLTEGKFSFPVVHGIHADTSNRQVLNVLQKRPTTPTLKIHTIDYLQNETKSFAYTQSVLTNLEAQTRNEIARLGGNKGLEAIMDFLHVDEL